jgi:hypothetical protein
LSLQIALARRAASVRQFCSHGWLNGSIELYRRIQHLLTSTLPAVSQRAARTITRYKNSVAFPFLLRFLILFAILCFNPLRRVGHGVRRGRRRGRIFGVLAANMEVRHARTDAHASLFNSNTAATRRRDLANLVAVCHNITPLAKRIAGRNRGFELTLRLSNTQTLHRRRKLERWVR